MVGWSETHLHSFPNCFLKLCHSIANWREQKHKRKAVSKQTHLLASHMVALVVTVHLFISDTLYSTELLRCPSTSLVEQGSQVSSFSD